MSGRMINGETIVEVEGRIFRGPTCVGAPAGRRYAALRRLFREAGDAVAPRLPPEPKPPLDPEDAVGKAEFENAAKNWQRMATAETLDVLATKQETWDVVADTLVGWTMDTPDGPIGLDKTTVFRGWPSGPLQVAANAWAAEGFLLPPGMHRPPAVEVGRSQFDTPTPSLAPDGRAI